MIWLAGIILIAGVGIALYSFISEEKPEKSIENGKKEDKEERKEEKEEKKEELMGQITRPKGIKIISILYFLLSLAILGLGIVSFFGYGLLNKMGFSFAEKFFAGIGIIFIIIGAPIAFTAIELWKYKNWARWVIIFLSLIGIIKDITYILKGNISGNIFKAAVNSTIGCYLFFSPTIKAIFEHQKEIMPLDKKLLKISVASIIVIVIIAVIFGIHSTPAAAPVSTPNTATASMPSTNSANITASTSSSVSKEKTQLLSAKDAWLKMKKESDGIKTYADLKAFILKYGSRNKIAQFKAKEEKIKALPPAFINQIIALAKGPSSKEITAIQEIVSGDTATLNVKTTRPGMTGTITLVLENNQWKLEEETWKSKAWQAE